MKKLICSILIFLMLPIACISFAGCGKKDYNIKTFYNDFKNITDSTTNLSLFPANDIYQVNNNSYKIDIDYTKSTALSNLVENENSQYYYLKYFYQQLLDDSLSPLYFFGEAIANNKKISKNQTKQIFTELNALKQDYQDIDYALIGLISSLNLGENSAISLGYLKDVFVEYEQAITTANRLSTIVCDVYFNIVISNSNYDYSIKPANQLTEADLTRISSDVRKRMYYYKSVYANIYNQLYLRGNNWAETLSSSTNASLPTYTPYNELANITSLANKSITSLIINKNTIHTNAVALFNIQNSFTEAYNNFMLATEKVVYSKLDASSSTDEHNYGDIIIQFSNGIAIDSYEILNKLIDLLYS